MQMILSKPISQVIESISEYPFGYEPLWKKIENFAGARQSSSGNFPPYNLIQEKGYCIYQFALAGFKKEDIKVEWDKANSILFISGCKKSSKEESKNYVHKGIAEREFYKKIFMTEDLLVDDVKMEDGILSVVLKENKKETDKPVVIPIS